MCCNLKINTESKSLIKSSKFHLVDLAGSERASKTHAVGERYFHLKYINNNILLLKVCFPLI